MVPPQIVVPANSVRRDLYADYGRGAHLHREHSIPQPTMLPMTSRNPAMTLGRVTESENRFTHKSSNSLRDIRWSPSGRSGGNSGLSYTRDQGTILHGWDSAITVIVVLGQIALLWGQNEALASAKRAGQHGSRTHEQRTQHGTHRVEKGSAEEGSTPEACQRKEVE
jgi:hypothetical protein